MIGLNFVVAVPLDPDLAGFLGKKGSENSITFYNRKSGSDVIVALAPSAIEEKFYAAAEALTIAGQVVLSTANIDALFGEMLVACSLLGKKVTFTTDNDIEGLLKSAGIENAEFAGRDDLLQKITSLTRESDEGTRVDIDKAFNVKGIGAVVLGVVTKGAVKVHDELHHSSGKKVIVRSIQSQDEDIQEAGCGTRVGLALKGIDEDAVEKGDLLTKEPNARVASISAKLDVSALSKEEVIAGKGYTLVCNFSASRATVESNDAGTVKLKLEKQLALMRGDEFLLLREQAPRIFAKGSVI